MIYKNSNLSKQLKAREQIRPDDFEKGDRVKFINGLCGTVTSISSHHVNVKFDGHNTSVAVAPWNLTKLTTA